MDAADLRVFEAVARIGSMKRAALELNTVQSNVTARIRLLELELGVSLFQRHAKGVRLTPAGRRMLPFPAKISKLIADARAAARDDGFPSGQLEIGTLETTAALRLPPILATFSKAYPEVALVVTTGTTCSLLSDVIDCRIDSAFVCGPVEHPDLHQSPIFTEELVLVTPRSVGSLQELVEMRDLKKIVFRMGCSYRQRLESYLSAVGVLSTRTLEFGAVEAILGCVAAGCPALYPHF
jgi:DNA-binding transcriptional LysR family regulator